MVWKAFKIFPSTETAKDVSQRSAKMTDQLTALIPGFMPCKINVDVAPCKTNADVAPSVNSALRARIDRDVSSRMTKEIMDTLLEELEKSRDANSAASKASDEALATLVSKFEVAANATEMESKALLFAEKSQATLARTAAMKASELRLAKQRLKYEAAATASAEAMEMKFKQLVQESVLSSKRMRDEVESKFAIERFNAILTTEIATESAELLLADQQEKYECAVSNANAALNLFDVTSKVAAKRARKEAFLAAKSAREERDFIVDNMKRQYERAAIAASDASELSMESLRFKSQLASHCARQQFDSRMLSERAESETAAKVAELTNAALMARQQVKYETAATAATEAYKSTIEILQEDSLTIIKAFNVEIEEKDLKYVLAKLSAERLEQQILTERLEQAAASAQRESELLLSVCGNVAHDLNSPLQTLIHGIESLRNQHTTTAGFNLSEDLGYLRVCMRIHEECYSSYN